MCFYIETFEESDYDTRVTWKMRELEWTEKGFKAENRDTKRRKTTNGEEGEEELDMYCNQIDHLEDTD